MLKLTRNTLADRGVLYDGVTDRGVLYDGVADRGVLYDGVADRGVLYDGEGRRISWSYIEALVTLQEEGIRLRNRVNKSQIQWCKQKNLAAQALSASVADALEYCDTELALPQFSESAATVK